MRPTYSPITPMAMSYAAEQQDGDDRRGHAGHELAADAHGDGDRDAREGEQRAREPDDGGDLQRRVAERRDGVEREAQHLAHGVLRLAGVARLAPVGHGGLGEADPD